MKPHSGNVDCHLKDEEGHGEGRAHPEPPGHVGEFGIWLTLHAPRNGFQRHAADRAVTWPLLADLWVHRTSIDNPLLRGGLSRMLWVTGHSCRLQIMFRIRDELIVATG